MRTKPPFPVFKEPEVLTDDTPVMGIPGKIWDEALTGNFVANLQEGNKVLKRQQVREALNTSDAPVSGFDAEVFTLAVCVFGTEKAACAWMLQPGFGLERQVPVELCRTPSGREVVLTYLKKLRNIC
jgi:hypothetical protein